MRMAEGCKVNREEFLKNYRGAGTRSELAGPKVGRLNGKGWKLFVAKHPDGYRQRFAVPDLRGGNRCQFADQLNSAGST